MLDELFQFPVSVAANRTKNPIRGIVDRLKVTNTEKTFISLALGVSRFSILIIILMLL